MGATFVHWPKKNNLIRKFMEEEKCESISALMNDEYYYYEDEGLLSEKFVDQVDELFERAGDFIEKKIDDRDQDMSVAEAVQDFIKDQLS